METEDLDVVADVSDHRELIPARTRRGHAQSARHRPRPRGGRPSPATTSWPVKVRGVGNREVPHAFKDGGFAGENMVSVDPLPGDREPTASGPHAGTASSARVRGPTAEERSRSESASTSIWSSGMRPCERRMSTEPVGASRSVERRENARVGKRERVRGSVARCDEREPDVCELPKSRGRHRREVGVDDERVAVDAGETGGDRAPRPDAGVRERSRRRGARPSDRR